MFEIQNEEYDEVKIALKDVLALLCTSKEIEIGTKSYNIDFHLGADYKMLRLLYGQKASNAIESWVWCRFKMNESLRVEDNFPIIRNLNDIDINKEPIINFIPFEKCVIDLLHLLLRITDQLYKLLFLKLELIKIMG